MNDGNDNFEMSYEQIGFQNFLDARLMEYRNGQKDEENRKRRLNVNDGEHEQ